MLPEPPRDLLAVRGGLVSPQLLREVHINRDRLPRSRRSHKCVRHAAVAIQPECERRRRRHRKRLSPTRPQVLVEPKQRVDLVLRRVLMVVVRRAGHAAVVGRQFLDRLGQVAQSSVEVVRRTEEHRRARHVGQGGIVGERRPEQRTVVVAVADAAARRDGRLHTGVRGGHHRQLAAHRVAVDAKPLAVDLRLRLQKRQRSPRRHAGQEPAAVAGRLDRVERPRGRSDAWESVAGVAGRGVVAVEPPPVGRDAVSRIVGLPAPKQLHLGRRDAIPRRVDPPGPGDRHRRVAPAGVRQAGGGIGVLPAAVDLHQPRHWPIRGRVRRGGVHGGHAGRLPLERADREPHDPDPNAILVPLGQRLGLQRFGLRIERRPERRERRRRTRTPIGRKRL